MKRTLKDITVVIGVLSKPSKMPGFGWGIPASHCKRGSKLRKIEGTICNKCYAQKGRYAFDRTQNCMEGRLEAYNNLPKSEWMSLITDLIRRKVQPEVPYFRIFDSGDLQSKEMLRRWIAIARQLPDIKFWLTTREHGIVKAVRKTERIPGNLLIRQSADMFNALPAQMEPNMNYSISADRKEFQNKEGILYGRHKIHVCPAPMQGGSCGDCRACWEKKVRIVCYAKH